jgi:hypothetical protein
LYRRARFETVGDDGVGGLKVRRRLLPAAPELV